MKKQFCILIAIFLLIFTSCKEDKDVSVSKEINPEHETSPPIAKDIFLQELTEPDDENNNLKFIAEFEKGTIDDQYLAVLLGDKEVVLRDDGLGADDKAGDNMFSVNIREDLELLKKELSQQKNTRISSESNAFFQGRKMVSGQIEKLREFNIEEIQKGRNARIPLDILIGGAPLTTDHKKTLMVTDVDVVEDPTRTFNPCTEIGNPNGAWTFGELMRQMASPNPGAIANNIQASNFVRQWLETWTVDQIVNGENVDERNTIQSIISDWENKSGVQSGGVLDMEFAPFKLIAIVNRLDLRGNSGYGFSNAGEGRLVFNALTSSCNPLQFTVIFEYGINKKSCNAVKSFAQEWQDLNSMILGSPAYNAALQDITDQFTLCGTNPSKPNENSINQIRTNEIALGSPWELREFNLMPTGQLELVTVKMEPAVKYNAKTVNPDVERLVDFINSNSIAIENDNYTVPDEYSLNPPAPAPTTPFLGGKSHTPFPPTGPPPTVHHWDGTNTPGSTFINSDLARHKFSLNTCSGCHGGETQTFFTHVKPANFGVEAQLSGFLTGLGLDQITDGVAPFFDDDSDPTKGFFVEDAALRPIPGGDPARSFSDLLRRENDLVALISNTCVPLSPFKELAHIVTFKTLGMTH